MSNYFNCHVRHGNIVGALTLEYVTLCIHLSTVRPNQMSSVTLCALTVHCTPFISRILSILHSNCLFDKIQFVIRLSYIDYFILIFFCVKRTCPQGCIRRGVNVEALKGFILGQGASKRIITMEWDKFWSENKKVNGLSKGHWAVKYTLKDLKNLLYEAQIPCYHPQVVIYILHEN